MAVFTFDRQAVDRLADRSVDRAREAGHVLIGQVHDTIRDGSPSSRSEPGEPPRSQSGELEESVRVLEAERIGTGAHVRVGTELIRGWWLEFGTATIAPRPWLRPSFEAARPEMLEAFRGLTEG